VDYLCELLAKTVFRHIIFTEYSQIGVEMASYGKMTQVEILEKRIKKEILPQYSPGNKLPSEKELAAILGNTQGRIHQAIAELVNEKALYSIPRFGTFVSGRDPHSHKLGANAGNNAFAKSLAAKSTVLSMPHVSAPLKIRISVPWGYSEESDSWQKAFDSFQSDYPFFEIEADYTVVPESQDAFDVMITCPYMLEKLSPSLSKINRSSIFQNGLSESELSEGVLETCMLNNELLAVPLLRINAGLWAKRERLDAAGLSEADFRSPMDFFINGCKIEKALNGGCHGFDYRGFIYHAAPFGIQMLRNGNDISFAENKLSELLSELGRYISKNHLRAWNETKLEQFLIGEIALFADYISLLPLDNKSFTYLGFPLAPGGFSCQNAYVACINKSSKVFDNAHILINYLLGAKPQQILTFSRHLKFSVRKDVYLEQKRKFKKMPPAQTDFDLRGYYSVMDPVIYFKFCNKINLEIAKYFCKLQSLDGTIEALRHV
jgi:DNA-binding transcriptional regulator YhcF (GntR family)